MPVYFWNAWISVSLKVEMLSSLQFEKKQWLLKVSKERKPKTCALSFYAGKTRKRIHHGRLQHLKGAVSIDKKKRRIVQNALIHKGKGRCLEPNLGYYAVSFGKKIESHNDSLRVLVACVAGDRR